MNKQYVVGINPNYMSSECDAEFLFKEGEEDKLISFVKFASIEQGHHLEIYTKVNSNEQ